MSDIDEMISRLPDSTRQSIEWQARAIEAIAYDKFDMETRLSLLTASLNKAHDEGIQDAIYLINHVASRLTGDRRHVLDTISTNLELLRKMNKADKPAALQNEKGPRHPEG